MRCDATAIEQPRRGKSIDAGANRSDPSRFLRFLNNPLRDFAINVRQPQPASAGNDQGVELRRRPDRRGGLEDNSRLGGKRSLRQPDDRNFVAAFQFPFSILAKRRSECLRRPDEVKRISLFVSEKSNAEWCHCEQPTPKTGNGSMTKIRQFVPFNGTG